MAASAFDLKKIDEYFVQMTAKSKEGESPLSLDMEYYVLAFRELNRFVEILGTLFHFVYTDLESKIGILNEYRTSDAEHYGTVEGMVQHEAEKKITTNPNKPSGCRTLLRLHRAMEYLISFFRHLAESPMDNTGTSSLSLEAYNATLANHHPFLVRNAARLAMYALPNKMDLLERMNQGSVKYGAEESVVILKDIVLHGTMVYDTVQKLYGDNQLLELP